jgi:N-acetylglucosamine kinase-like BadF-type ATPase
VTDGLILGIDGGGSKVLIVLADRSGAIVRAVRGGGVNPMDNRNWQHDLQAKLRCFVDASDLVGIAAGLPAYGEVEQVSQTQRDAIASAFGGTPQTVLNDVDAAHLGAFAGGPGVLILSGTGSMAWARDAAGNSYRVGGWGDVIGDEGSSYWIGRRALSLVSQSLDGRATSRALVEAVFEHLGLDRSQPMGSLEGWVFRLRNARAGVAGLSVLVDRAARDGDADAQAIINQAADELVKHVTAIAQYCGPAANWTYAGGAFASRVLLDAVTERIERPPVPPRLPPVGGAVLAAAMKLGWPVDAAFIERLAAATYAVTGRIEQTKPT